MFEKLSFSSSRIVAHTADMDKSMIGRWLLELPWDDLTPQSTSTSARPLLRRFVHYQEPIEYVRYLGGGGETSSGVVYLVRIAGREYAIKVISTNPFPKIWKNSYICPEGVGS